MITFIYGDLFASRAVALVNPVNCAGAMGTPPGRAVRASLSADAG